MSNAEGDGDPRVEFLAKLAKAESQYSDENDSAEARWMVVVETVADRWRSSWRGQFPMAKPNLELANKFRVVFPLAAHALNHLDTAVSIQSCSPWVAVASARIAFEHALTAQWVLWTEGGEDALRNQMSLQDHKRSVEFVEAVKQAAAGSPSLAESAELAEELGGYVGQRPSSDWSVFTLCERFSDTRLLYGIYRDLSQAVHPSIGLVRAHFDITDPPNVVVGQIIPNGAGFDSVEVTRGLAVSGLWALYSLEISLDRRAAAKSVLQLGEEAGLPVDLRASDLFPHLQPGYLSVFVP